MASQVTPTDMKVAQNQQTLPNNAGVGKDIAGRQVAAMEKSDISLDTSAIRKVIDSLSKSKKTEDMQTASVLRTFLFQSIQQIEEDKKRIKDMQDKIEGLQKLVTGNNQWIETGKTALKYVAASCAVVVAGATTLGAAPVAATAFGIGSTALGASRAINGNEKDLEKILKDAIPETRPSRVHTT